MCFSCCFCQLFLRTRVELGQTWRFRWKNSHLNGLAAAPCEIIYYYSPELKALLPRNASFHLCQQDVN